ncbi:hypothetical protein TNCT_692432 [Trichonephila clavata]|uniref:Uncharacterized protein n=1 Tax=Trichonephila clavata TaxID=2740835 RepID=A0A8X6M1G0_TRICU|nr:hypothetical protein TNCT_692432 [Trichonephila clavata]
MKTIESLFPNLELFDVVNKRPQTPEIGSILSGRLLQINSLSEKLCFLFVVSQGDWEAEPIDFSRFLLESLQVITCVCSSNLSSVSQKWSFVIYKAHSVYNRKHKYCITEKVAIENYFCIQPMLKELAKLGKPEETQEYQENHLKVSCSFLDKADECSQGNILRTCGEEAAEFRKKISLPSIILSKLACCEVGFQFEDFDCSLTQPRDEKVFELTSPSTYYSSLTQRQLFPISSTTDRSSIASTLLGKGHFNVTSAPLGTSRLRTIFPPLNFIKSKDILTSTSNNMGRVDVGSAYEPTVGTHDDSERVLSTNSEIPFSTDRLTATVAPHVTAHFETVSPQFDGSALPE